MEDIIQLTKNVQAIVGKGMSHGAKSRWQAKFKDASWKGPMEGKWDFLLGGRLYRSKKACLYQLEQWVGLRDMAGNLRDKSDPDHPDHPQEP